MPRKILISFLGTNDYVPCNYYTEGDDTQKVSNVRYIQKAIIDLYCQDFNGPDDGFHFFLTDDAKARNWEDNGQYNRNTGEYDKTNDGLKSVIHKLNLSERAQTHSIKEGYSTNDIWKIFEQVFDVIQEGDEIILDITHGFRSLPMLAMVLSNYAKTLKNADLKMVLYGAFEKLGPAPIVRQIPEAERNAPILNLTALSDIQDWTSATKNFVENGISTDLGFVIEKAKRLAPKDQIFINELKDLKNNLNLFTSNLKLNRGKEILEGDYYADIQASISMLRSKTSSHPPLSKILDQIDQKVGEFIGNSSTNWIKAVDWCMEKGLIQQAITQLQEGIVTQVCKILSLKPSRYIERNVAKGVFYNPNKKGKVELLPDDIKKLKENQSQDLELFYVNKIKEGLENDFIKDIRSDFKDLTDLLRNDINHGGYNKSKNVKEIEKNINKFYKSIREKAQNHNII
jgi:CRISPR-associated Csx2 family protein